MSVERQNEQKNEKKKRERQIPAGNQIQKRKHQKLAINLQSKNQKWFLDEIKRN